MVCSKKKHVKASGSVGNTRLSSRLDSLPENPPQKYSLPTALLIPVLHAHWNLPPQFSWTGTLYPSGFQAILIQTGKSCTFLSHPGVPIEYYCRDGFCFQSETSAFYLQVGFTCVIREVTLSCCLERVRTSHIWNSSLEGDLPTVGMEALGRECDLCHDLGWLVMRK